MTQEKATIQTSTLESPMTRAIACDTAYRDLSRQVEDLKTERNLLLEEAYETGEFEMDGYRIIMAKEAETVTFDSVLDYDLDNGTSLQTDYIAWYRQNCPLKITPDLFEKFLKDTATEDEIPTILASCKTLKETEACRYRLMPPKKVSE